MGLLQAVDHVVQDVHAGVDGTGKVCLLGADDLLDISIMLAQLGVCTLAGQDAVGHHEGAAADVVGDDTDGNVGLGILLVGLARDVLHMVQHALHGIHLKQVAHVLHHAGQTLQAHAGINVGACQTLVVALAVGIKLAEHEVPDLHIAVAYSGPRSK